MKKIFLIVLCIMAGYSAQCSHIVGGEIFYDCVGNNNYHVTLKLYRNCSVTCLACAPYSNPDYLTIFDASGNVYLQPAITYTDTVNLPVTGSNLCSMNVPSDVCVEEADYTCNVSLPPSPGGYTIVYQRCCRSDGLLNLAASLGVGATYTCEIPDAAYASGNNSARFDTLSPLYVCLNAPLSIDYSASDPDGDSLVYSLCDPYNGADGTCPDPTPNNNDPGCPTAPNPPPYTACIYNVPYSASNFTNSPSSNGNLTIDPHTGLLTSIPNTLGLFDITVCVSEYRSGHLLNVLRRDFQFTVTQCSIPIALIAPTVNTCNSLTVNFSSETYDPNAIPLSFMWTFGIPGSTTDTSSLASPSFTYTDTGTYRVQLVASIPGTDCKTDTSTGFAPVYPVFTGNFSDVISCSDSSVSFTDQTIAPSNPASSWLWYFGDGTTSIQQNPVHTYIPGIYNVQFVERNEMGCIDSIARELVICPSDTTTGIINDKGVNITLYPNPAKTYAVLNYNLTSGQQGKLEIYNQVGQLVFQQILHGNTNSFKIRTNQLQSGVYEYRFTLAGQVVKRDKFIVMK